MRPTELETTEEEAWRPISGWDGIYEVSSLGNIRRILPFFITKKVPYNLKPSGKPYVGVTLSGNGNKRRVLVHILVCEAFHGKRPSPDYEATHNDGSSKNNHYLNLSWKTRLGNAEDKRRHGTQICGEKVNTSILTERDVLHIRELAKLGFERKSLAKAWDAKIANVNQIVVGRTWKHLLPEQAA
jgi:hypothetical protein